MVFCPKKVPFCPKSCPSTKSDVMIDTIVFIEVLKFLLLSVCPKITLKNPEVFMSGIVGIKVIITLFRLF